MIKKFCFSLILLFGFSIISFADVFSKNPIVQDEGTTVDGGGRIFNFTGAGVTATFAGGKYIITIGGGSGYSIYLEEGDTAKLDNSAADMTIDFGSGFDVSVVGAEANITLDFTEVANAGTDITADLEEETHASEHAVSGADTTYPVDPNADGILIWDDNPGTLEWGAIGSGLSYDGTTLTATSGSGDITSVGDVASGAAFDGTQGTILTFNNAGGDGTLDYDGTDFSFSHGITLTSGIFTGNLTGNVTGNADTATTATSATTATTATTANAGDSATAFFSSGTIEHEYGGLEANVSAYNGLLKISSGTTSSITDSSTNWDTAYTHSQDNTQAHSDYLLNSGDDSTSGTLTAANFTTSGKVTSPELENTGNITIDAINASANSTVTVTNSDATYTTTLNADAITEGGVAVYNDDEMDTYAEINAIVADVTLTHNGLIDTFSELNAIVADVTLVHTGTDDDQPEAGDYAAASIDGDDINSNLAGRSLTLTAASPDTLDADIELYTDVKTLYLEDPTASDDLQTIWVAPVACTITKIHYESDQTVVFDLQIDDGTPTGVNGSDITCTTFATDSSLAGDTTMAAGDRLDLAITSVSGTPTWFSVSWEFTYDD